MVVSRSDSKRRKKEGADSLQDSPKRTKVHAQRKFAQGSHLNNPVLTPVKDKDKTKYNGTVLTAELLPIKRPKTEQFVNFLCFRGSDMLPKSLEFFNEPSIPEPLASEEDVKREGPSTSRGGHRSSDKHGDQTGGVAKAEARNKIKSKSIAAVQALKKKYQEQRMNKEKRSLTKLALKAAVKGKNMIRTRSSGPLDEKPATASALQKKRTTRLVTTVKSKAVPSSKKPVLRKHTVVVKRIPSKSPVTRGGLRSSGGLPPGSDEGIKTERKTRKASPLKKSVKNTTIASSLSDFSSDDDQPLVKKQRVVSKASVLASRITTRSRLMTKPSTSLSSSSRPPRKTKEAATLFMEMLKKDLRSPDEEEDNVDDNSSRLPDSPKRTERRGSKDSTENIKIDKKPSTKSLKKETKQNEKVTVRKNRKLSDKPASRLTSLKTRTLRRNSYRLVAKEIEFKRLKTNRAKPINRTSSRSSSKDISHDNSDEVDKTPPKEDRNIRRERRSLSNPIKTSEIKEKEQKTVIKENDSSSSKVSSKKKAVETTFDDSDEEPLGKKVNQSTSGSGSKTFKKAKHLSDKEDLLSTVKAEVLEQKSTRRRFVNTTQDSSKEDVNQSAQHSASSEHESIGKVKSEAIIKPKACDKDLGTVNTKSKQVFQANDTRTNVTQKLKEAEKNAVKNTAQVENKGKISSVKGNEIENKTKLQEDSSASGKKKQTNKNLKKCDTKKSLDVGGIETGLTLSSKDALKISKLKSSTENISGVEVDPSLHTTKESTEKSSLGKTMSKKNVTSANKGAGNVKNKNKSLTSSEIKMLEPKKVSVKSSDKIHSLEDFSLNFKRDLTNKSNNLPVLENLPKSIQIKPSGICEDITSDSSRNLGNTKKQQNTKKNSLSDLSGIDSAKKETCKKEETADELDENNESSQKSNSVDITLNSPSLLGRPVEKIISQEKISENIQEAFNLCSAISEDTILRVASNNNSQKQTSSSPAKGKNIEKSKQEVLKIVQPVPNPNDLKNKPKDSNLLDKTNDNDSIKPSKLASSPKGVAEDNTKTKDILPHDSKVLLTGQTFITGLESGNPNSNEIAVSLLSFSGEKDKQIVTETCYSNDATLFANVNNSYNYVLEKDLVVSREVCAEHVTPTKQQPNVQHFPFNPVTRSDEKNKNRSPTLEPTINKNLTQGKCLSVSPALISSDLKGMITEQLGNKEDNIQTQDFKTDLRKLGAKEEIFIDNTSKLGGLEMSDKISTAVETLMSLKNVHKIDEKSFINQTGSWNVKGGQTYDIELKRVLEHDLKRLNETDQKLLDSHDCKKIKIKEGEVNKRVTIQEPEFKRFNPPETDIKRSNLHESDFRRFHVQDQKPKIEHPQVLKGCSNPKSMLKPGTLIDIAGISHSPEIMTPLRPGVDGEIIPMNRPIRPFGQEVVDPFKASVQGFKPYDPRAESSTYGFRWQSSSSEKTSKSEQLSEKEADSKSKTPVNESAWRQAFKNVKDPKSSNNIPTEKPAIKKQLSVTALAKKHKSKSEIVYDKNTQPQTSASIPFLRHNKPFLGPSPSKTKHAGSDRKKSNCTDVDPASLREKEAEVEEFLRQCGEYSRSLAPAVPHANSTVCTKSIEDINRSGSVQSLYLSSHIDSKTTEEHSLTSSDKILGSHQPLSDVRYTPIQLSSHHDQSETSTIFASDSVKRAGSPLKFEKRQISTSSSIELSPYSKSSLPGMASQQDHLSNQQIPSASFIKQDQSLGIFQIDSARKSNSPKSFMPKSALTGSDIKSKFDDSSFSSTCPASNVGEQVTVASFLVGTHQTSVPVNTAKQPLPNKARHFSPNRSSQSGVAENLFRDSNLTKRTKSPTLLDSYSQQNSSPKGNSISRNTNSPVGKCSTTNIFKEIVPAKRSYSPTLSSTTQNDHETNVPNVFSQNPNFRRSVSPLSNKSGFPKIGTADTIVESAKKTGAIEKKKVEVGFQDPVIMQPSRNMSSPIERKTFSSVLNQNLILSPNRQIESNVASIEESLVFKEEVIELDEPKCSDSVNPEDNTLKPEIKPFTEEGNEKPPLLTQDIESGSAGKTSRSNIASMSEGNEKPSLLTQDIESGSAGKTSRSNIASMSEGNEKPPLLTQDIESGSAGIISRSSIAGMSEAKHRLPLAVEQTLKKLGQNKKPSLLPKVKFSEPNMKSIQSQSEDLVGQNETGTVGVVSLRDTQFVSKLTTGIYSHNQEGELDLMQKKKVNMSAEEIKRWLNDSSTSEVDHRVNCGILENNTCECEYRNTLAPNLQNIDLLKFETVSKTEGVCLNKSISNQFDVTETGEKKLDSKINLATPENCEVSHSFETKEKDKKDAIIDIKKEEIFSPEAVSIVKYESQKNIVSTNKSTASNKMKDDCLVSIRPVVCVAGGSENIKQPPTTPPASKLRTFRLPNKNADIEPKPTTSDILDVSITPARDDASSSNDLSSSNEETPEKSHSERKSIFHQRRSTLRVKERRELLAPSVNAFSPENESSVYAFDPELPPTSTPFRRSKGKDGKSTCTTTDDEELTPSSNSIAVQVNFDNEAVLECSTQTDVQEGDDDDTHTFYIPLQQSAAADTNKPPLIQGVAVKVDTEGPDQKVIMRAKLVTKPLSTFNQSSTTPRSLIGTRSGKPEQKVRPLSVKLPVGTVQPTARPKPKPVATQEDQPGSSKSTTTTCSPQAARLAKRIKSKAAVPSTSVENHPPKVPPAKLVEAPTFYPTEKEFEDPLEYISSITPQAEKYGLCRVVPPSNFKPECKVSDDMRFTAYNQYIHKMLHRWGPNVKEMLAIKKYLATQSIALTHPPWIGGMEVDLPRLYQTVQQCGGLKEVIEKKRWQRVADQMKIPKSAQDRVTKLDDIYCKFLLPYDTLSHVERTQLFEGVERDWIEREKRVANQQDAPATDSDEDSDSDSDSDIDECIVKGRSMALNGFYRIARNTMSMWFPKTDTPSAAEVELEFWKHVASRQHHVCVHSGSIDSGAMGYGFPTGKNSSTSRHPWNLKMLTNNPGSTLRFLGPIMGVTVPTLHVGMLFSACCWYRDPHGLPWIEYLHTGASKIWYGIPDSSSSQFRDAVMSIVPRLCRDKTLWLASDTAMVPPPLLVEKGVSLSRIVQDPGQFIIVFPKAFTSSICTGYLVSESVYFAQPSWLCTAQALFNDLRESSEPTVFSLEKLLFSIVNDSRASADVLNQILGIVVSLRDGEVAGRRQLEELGLNSSERLNSKRKGKARPAGDGEEDLECEECRMTLYISWMSNSQDGSVYCLPHAVELLSNKRSLVKHCTLVYAFSEEELEELVEKLKSRVESKNQKKSVAKSSKS